MSQDVSSGPSEAETETLTAEIRDGQLQIVEVTPFEKADEDATEIVQLKANDQTTKYVQVVDANGKGLMQLDLLNLTLVRCGDGNSEYRLMTSADGTDNTSEFITPDSVTCVLQSSDGEEHDDQESYVVVRDLAEHDDQESYVMVEGGEQGPMVFLQSDLQQTNVTKPVEKEVQKTATTLEILQRAKALQKAKSLLKQSLEPQRGRGRRRKTPMPPPGELLASPNFKLFLYSCKMCNFKCNAIRELTAHRTSEHGAQSSAKYRGGGVGGRSNAITLQCAKCPFRGNTNFQLMRHVQDHHMDSSSSKAKETEKSEEDPQDMSELLICSSCGFSSGNRAVFKKHVADMHMTKGSDDDEATCILLKTEAD